MKWPKWLRATPDKSAAAMETWEWTGPADEGPPIVLYGRWRWQAEQRLMELVEEFDALLKDRYRLVHGPENLQGSLFDRLHYFQNVELLTNEELAIWRAALQVRSAILGSDRHDTPMPELAHHAQAVSDVVTRVRIRIDNHLSSTVEQ